MEWRRGRTLLHSNLDHVIPTSLDGSWHRRRYHAVPHVRGPARRLCSGPAIRAAARPAAAQDPALAGQPRPDFVADLGFRLYAPVQHVSGWTVDYSGGAGIYRRQRIRCL